MKKITTTPFYPTDIKVETVSQNRARISAYPFENGYAITVAHPLRRLLLSSSIGYAPTALKVEGATHEFDSIRGMVEDISIFIINLKNIRFKIKDDKDRVVLNYSFAGPKTINGQDLENDLVEIVTPDSYLATINSDITLEFTIVIQRGIGYVPSENIDENIGDNFIILDAFFTPIRKAVYSIENMLVEDDPNYGKIVFDIATDGQISPVDAFGEALSVIQSQLSVFNKVFEVDTIVAETQEPVATTVIDFKEFMLPISELNLGARSFNALEKAKIQYLAELVLMSEDDIKNIKNLGKKSFDEISVKLSELGYPINDLLEESKAKALIEHLKSLKD
jgi:DNA-directed RNA polymerase subunit alpha